MRNFQWVEAAVLIAITLVVHAMVLRYIYPGYYNPLWPNHADFYYPVALGHSSVGIIDLLKSPRPVCAVFSFLAGHLAIREYIATIIGIVVLNCVLSAILLRRILGIDFKWPFIISFLFYLYLIFSQAHFYIFYTEDYPSQLSYFLLISAAWCFYIYQKRSSRVALTLLFFLSLLAFLSKETFELSSLVIAATWMLYSRREGGVWVLAPVLMVGGATLVSLFFSFWTHSKLFGYGVNLSYEPYKIVLAPASVFKEWMEYARQALNLFNMAMFLLIGFACYRCSSSSDKRLIYVFFGCILAAVFAWIPNSILPNHHLKLYSSNSAYLLFLPVMIIPIFWQNKRWLRIVFVMVIVLSIWSPVFNMPEYSTNSWDLNNEWTQRRLLNSLYKLLDGHNKFYTSERILVTGMSFSFNPFIYPMSLRSFSKGPLPKFDIVAYNYHNFEDEALGDTVDWVKFIRPEQVNLKDYSEVWMFARDGHLFQDLKKD